MPGLPWPWQRWPPPSSSGSRRGPRKGASRPMVAPRSLRAMAGLAVENSHVGAMSDEGEVVLDFRLECHGCQTDEPAIGVAVPQRFDSVGRMGQRGDLFHQHIEVEWRTRSDPRLAEFGTPLNEQAPCTRQVRDAAGSACRGSPRSPPACGRPRGVHRHGIEARWAGVPTMV
jgi:hypothetical protein